MSSSIYELLPFLFPFWAIIVVFMTWATGGVLALVVPTVVTLALVPVISVLGWEDEDVVFTLYLGGIIVLFGAAFIVTFPFYKGIVWYIIGEPMVSVLSYVATAPAVVGTIVFGIAGLTAVGVSFTLWRTGPTADLSLIFRMIVSLVLLAGVTLAFFIAVWRVIEYTVWFCGVFLLQLEPGPWRTIARTITAILVVSFVYHELARIRVVDRRGDVSEITSDEFPTLHATTTAVAAQLDVPKPTIAVAERDKPEAMAVGYRPGNIYLILSDGLLDALDEAELEAVVAHELAHVANMDAMVMTVAFFPIHFAEGLKYRVNDLRGEDSGTDVNQSGDESQRGLFRRGLRILVLVILSPLLIGWYIIKLVAALLSHLNEKSPHWLVWGALLAIAYVTRLLSRPAIAVLSRARESAADRTAATVTGSPAALASALQALDGQITETPSEDLRKASSLSSLSILPLDPIDTPADQNPDDGMIGYLLTCIVWILFATHPLTDCRIETLRALETEKQ